MHISNIEKQVRDMWANGCWCFHNIATWVPDDIKGLIASITIPMSEGRDGWIWKSKVDGNYTSKHANGWLLDRYRHGKLQVPEKVKILIWMCLYRAFPTNIFRTQHGLASSPGCTRWSATQEDILHCLRECPHSCEI